MTLHRPLYFTEAIMTTFREEPYAANLLSNEHRNLLINLTSHDQRLIE